MKTLLPPFRYLNIPNVMTSLSVAMGGICLGLLSVGNERLAAALFLLVFTLDFSDGIVARKLNQETEIGLQMDSLADLINFCVIPSLVGWMMGMQSIPEILFLIAYVLAGLWRLAFFNVHGLESAPEGSPSFIGLPTTYAACYFLVIVIISRLFSISFEWLGPLFFSAASVLMVCALKIRKKGILLPVTIVMTVGSVILFFLY